MKIRIEKNPPARLVCGLAATPHGQAVIAVTGQKEICRIQALEDQDIIAVVEHWQNEWPKTMFVLGPVPKSVARSNLLMISTEVQARIWQEIMRIPRGQVASYGEVAARAGFPRAARAVGTACRKTILGYLIPCHRVISASGIGGYGRDGMAEKRRLLAEEGVFL